ncbi:hypothetical protein [Providencia sp.]|uniref:hypothetical protein n=1 Tax=Providencia sp. TaxID=589 RepID=UPI003F9C60ED
MDITLKAKSAIVEPNCYQMVEVKLNGTSLDGEIDVADIVNEYSASTLLDGIDNDDIIEHLENQGYTVTKD